MKTTPAQKKLLTNARDHGNAWRTASGSLPYRASTDRCIQTLVSKGLLAYAAGRGHTAPEITAEGLAAL
jgi:hypothetical protein